VFKVHRLLYHSTLGSRVKQNRSLTVGWLVGRPAGGRRGRGENQRRPDRTKQPPVTFSEIRAVVSCGLIVD